MSDIVIPIETALASAGIFGTFVFFPLMKIEQHIAKMEANLAKVASVVENCPYCTRKMER